MAASVGRSILGGRGGGEGRGGDSGERGTEIGIGREREGSRREIDGWRQVKGGGKWRGKDGERQ